MLYDRPFATDARNYQVRVTQSQILKSNLECEIQNNMVTDFYGHCKEGKTLRSHKVISLFRIT